MSNNKPKIIRKHKNSIIFNWKNLFPLSYNIFKLEILDEFKKWKLIYWGPKYEIKVEHLAPSTLYNFRLKPELEEFDWLYFKSSTDVSGFLVVHLSRAISLGRTADIRQIVHSCSHLLETEDKHHKTPLIQAIETGNVQVFQLLLTLGAKVNAALIGNKRTPLMIAIYNSQLQLAQILIDKGSNILATDINGLNILHFAVDSNNINNVKFVLNTGIDVNLKDRSGWTPLLRAVILNCNQEIIDLLLANDSNKSIKDKNNFNYNKHCELKQIVFNRN